MQKPDSQLMGKEWMGKEFLIAAVGTAIIVLIRIYFAQRLHYCGSPDSCVSLALGEALSRHQGFHVNFVVDYQSTVARLPSTGIEYWLPGTSFFLLLAQPFGGVTAFSGSVVAIAATVVTAMAAWKIAKDFSGRRDLACAAYLLCLVMGPLWINTADAGTFYGMLVSWFLALFQVKFRSYTQDALAMLCLMVAYTIRNDITLLVVPVVVILWLRRRAGGKGSSAQYALLAMVCFFAASLPMKLIDLAVLGTAFPSGPGKALYLRDLSELGWYGVPVSMHTMMSGGIRALIKLRLTTFPLVVYRMFFLLCGFGVVFLAPMAMRDENGRRPARPEIAGGAAFLATVLLVYGLVLPAVGIFSALRSSVALMPLYAVLMACGIDHLSRSRRLAVAVTAGVVVFYSVMGIMDTRRTLAFENTAADQNRIVAAFLASHGVPVSRGSVVMIPDQVQFSETTGYSAVPPPSNGLPAVGQAVEALHVQTLVLFLVPGAPNMEELRAFFHPSAIEPIPDTPYVFVQLPPR